MADQQEVKQEVPGTAVVGTAAVVVPTSIPELEADGKLFIRDAQFEVLQIEGKIKALEVEAQKKVQSVQQFLVTEAKRLEIDVTKHTFSLERLAYEPIASLAKAANADIHKLFDSAKKSDAGK